MPWTCRYCAIRRDKPESRLPSGWKRAGEDACCANCWRERYLLRAITLPIVSPLDCDWKTLDAALKEMWRATTQASNWIMTELYARDVRRQPGDEKMPSMAPIYLYPELRKRWPALPSQTVATLEQNVKKKYMAARYKVVWTCEQSLPSLRYPVPFPVPAQGWSVAIEEERPVISLRVGEQRLRFRLHGGPRYRRQRKAIEQMVSGEAITCEMALYRAADETLAKLVAWLPRREQTRDRSGILRVRTAADSLLVAVNDKDETLWRYNADHLRRWIAEHRNTLQRLTEDQKYEQRPVPSFAARREDAARKFRQRMDSATHEIAAQLANYAVRRKFAGILYDDSERGYVPQFSYYRLASLIQEKCDAAELEFALASAEAQSDVAEALATMKMKQ